MNSYVDFPTAKFLSSKGYSKDMYNHDHNEEEWILFGIKMNEIYFPFPTIADVVMWLHEKHGIWITVYNELDTKWGFNHFDYIISKNDKKISRSKIQVSLPNRPSEAYLEAINHALKNLI